MCQNNFKSLTKIQIDKILSSKIQNFTIKDINLNFFDCFFKLELKLSRKVGINLKINQNISSHEKMIENYKLLKNNFSNYEEIR